MFISESKIGRDENKDVRYACGFIFVATDQVWEEQSLIVLCFIVHVRMYFIWQQNWLSKNKATIIANKFWTLGIKSNCCKQVKCAS